MNNLETRTDFTLYTILLSMHLSPPFYPKMMKVVVLLCLVCVCAAFKTSFNANRHPAGSVGRVKQMALQAKSKALPFLEAPSALDGAYRGTCVHVCAYVCIYVFMLRYRV